MIRFGVIDPINALVYGVVAAVTLAAGWGVWGLVIATYASALLRASMAWLLAGWLPDLREASFAMWRELARYGRSIVTSEFLNQISGIVNTLLVGRFLGLAPLGGYRFGWRIATQAAVLFGSAAYPLFPAFARIADEPDRFRASFLRAIRLMAVLAIPAGVALIPLAEQIAVVLLGERWRSTGHVLAALAAWRCASLSLRWQVKSSRPRTAHISWRGSPLSLLSAHWRSWPRVCRSESRE